MLVVGHNCPGCGLDTPAVACEACGADVVWDRESGSHCSACEVSASTFSCPECGLRAELDTRPPEPALREVPRLSAEDDDAADKEPAPSPALLARFGTALASAPLVRMHAIAVVGLHGLAIALLIGGYDGGRPAPHGDVALARVVAAPVPDRLTRVQLPLDAKPVPLLPPPPGTEPPPMPEPRLALSPPTVSVTRVDTSPRPAPRNEGWLQRVLRSGRTYSPASDRFPADTAGIGR
jgi:hypothetical protein